MGTGDAPKGRTIAERFRVDGTMSRRGDAVTLAAENVETGAKMVIKECSHPVRAFPESDPRRSVWTRLILPWEVERGDGVTRILRPFVDGTGLDDLLDDGPPTLAASLAIGIDLLRALESIHGLGLAHGAVKPSNVILDASSGRAWLVDPAAAEPGSLGPGSAAAPPPSARYRAPELAPGSDAPVGPASDLYAVGAVLFECLSGSPLRGTDGEPKGIPVPAAPASVRARGASVPRVLDELVGRLLRTDARDRFASAAGALEDLLELERRMARGDVDPPLVVGLRDIRSTPTEPGLAGRTDELAALDRLIGLGRAGNGTLIRLEARSGDGKTRILDEVAVRAVQRGDRILRAEAHELEAPRPFGMLDGLATSLLDAAAADPGYADRIAEATGRWGPELRTVLPSLAHLLEAADEGGFGRSAESRILDALAALFDALGSRERPAVLLLDDCQWADELSLRVVERWSAREPASRYVTVVASLRTEEIPEEHAARRWSEGGTVTLDPLGPSPTRDLVSSMIGPIPAEAHAVIHHLSEGRPFVITGVVRALIESEALRPGSTGWTIDPQTLASLTSTGEAETSLVLRRLGRLPDETLRFLSAAAVLGRHASVIDTARLAGIDERRTGPIVEEARRAGLIWPNEGHDGFSFVHDKVREGALGRLGEAERRALHLAAAELIERQRPGDLFDLAYHFDRGGAPERALAPASEAAALARTRQALDSAETMYRIAIRGLPVDHRRRRGQMAEELGEVLMLRGAYEEAARWLEEARSFAGSTFEEATIEGRIGELAFKRGDVRTAAAAIERALRMIGRRVPRTRAGAAVRLVWELLVQMTHSLLPRLFVGRRPLEDGRMELLASRLHGRLGYAWWFERNKLATLWTHFRSLNLAERYPPTPELAQAYSEHAPAMMLVPWHRRGVRFAQRSHAIRVQLGDLWGQGQSLHFWGAGLYAASEFALSLERMREALELLERTGDRWEVNNCRLEIAMAMYRLGDLAGAVAMSKAARDAGIEIGDAQARGIGLEAWAKASDGGVPADVIRAELERSSEDVLTLASVLQAEGVRLLSAGDPEGAISAFEESQGLFRRAGMKNAGVSPVRPWLLTALRRAAERVPPDEAERRRDLLRRARSVAAQAGRRARFYRNDLPHVLRERGRLAALRGHPRRARSLFRRSLEVAIGQGARAEALRTRIALGEVGRALGWADEAEDGAVAERELEGLLATSGSPPPTGARSRVA